MAGELVTERPGANWVRVPAAFFLLHHASLYRMCLILKSTKRVNAGMVAVSASRPFISYRRFVRPSRSCADLMRVVLNGLRRTLNSVFVL